MPPTLTEAFLANIARGVNETQKRELFIAYAAQEFGDAELAQELALGAEYAVRFRAAGLVRRGQVDSLYGNLVIEFENRLAATGAHALEQLQGYVAGAWGEEGTTRRPYLAVAADGAVWEVYVPTLADPAAGITKENIALDLVESWPGRESTPSSLRDFLNRLLFRSTLVRPTASNFARDFGLASPAFARASVDLSTKYAELAGNSQVTVLREQWSNSLQLAYGAVNADDELFIKHTYLAVLARLLVWAAFERNAPSDLDLDDVLSGRYFLGERRIANLVEDDFFKWHAIASPTNAHRTWRALAKQLRTYDMDAVDEDVLKPLYEQLVDPEFRHELGEFYTPDWLATAVTNHLMSNWTEEDSTPSVLDPACGSGTFLRAAIANVLPRASGGPAERLDAILGKIAGIDVHPLAVIIARSTYALAIRDLIEHAPTPISIPVFLANSLHVPAARRRQTTMFDWEPVTMNVAGQNYIVPVDFVRDGPLFDAAIDHVVAVAKTYGTGEEEDLPDAGPSVLARLGTLLDDLPGCDDLRATIATLAVDMARLVHDDRNSVYGFLLKNQFRPAMIRHSFDYVLGNPPWLTVGDISTDDYKALVTRLATELNIAPRRQGEQRHTELATLFLAQAASEFVQPRPDTPLQVGFVMTRSVFSASHHRLLRAGNYQPVFDVAEIWDLDAVGPLFNVPSCVLFLNCALPNPTALKRGKEISGRLPSKEMSSGEAAPYLTWEDCGFELASLGRRTAWRKRTGRPGRTTARRAALAREQPYVHRFRQGAVLYPQNLLVVTVDGPAHRGRGTVRVQTDPHAAGNARVLRDVRVNTLVDSENLFCTAAAEHILPFAVSPDWTVVLPTTTDPDSGETFRPASPGELRRAGRVNTAEWLDWANGQWETTRRENDVTPLWIRLDQYNHFNAQGNRAQFIVLYTASGSRTVAGAVDIRRLPLPFVARDKTYWGSFSTREEADYLVALLNSDIAADQIRDWMTRGLFGPRDIHKRILDVPWARFDVRNGRHRHLAEVGARIREAADALLPHMPDRSTGARRTWLRGGLPADLLAEAEALVEAISVRSQRRTG